MMKKRWIVALMLVLCLCLLAGCKSSEPQKFQVATAKNGNAASTDNQGGVLVDGDYMDPLAEEDDSSWMEELVTPEPPTPTPAPTVRGEYAGATPVPIDPIDKPTPTQVPPMAAFSYRTYEATKLGVSFEAPAGWKVETSDSSDYVLRNPEIVGGYQAEVVIHAERVSKQYSESDLKNVVKSMLNSIGALDVVVEFSPSSTASRNLLDAKGVYANYTATLSNGAEIYGRVHATCVDKVLYTLHVSSPRAYWEVEGQANYKEGVYDKIRHTIQITK